MRRYNVWLSAAKNSSNESVGAGPRVVGSGPRTSLSGRCDIFKEGSSRARTRLTAGRIGCSREGGVREFTR
jgi:hypothetical protein